mgnify:FL=1
MYLTYDEAKRLKEEMSLIDLSNIELILCPSYLNFNIFKDYKLGSQDSFYIDKGPYTAEVSSYDLSLRGIKYSLVGHKDRRKYDDDKVINLKIKSLLKNSMTPILCIGESKLDKELMRTPEVLKKQLEKALNGIYLEEYQTIYIAYEPSYLIGLDNALSVDKIIDTLDYIKKIVDFIGIKNYKLLYGGAVNSSNIKELLSDKIDGYLLGKSSVDINELEKIIKCIK